MHGGQPERSWSVPSSLGLSATGPQVAAGAQPEFIATDADWLTTVNYFREMAGLPAVTEDPALSAGAYQHSCYMLANGICARRGARQARLHRRGRCRRQQRQRRRLERVRHVGAQPHRAVDDRSVPRHRRAAAQPADASASASATTRRRRRGARARRWTCCAAWVPRRHSLRPSCSPATASTTSLTKFVVESPDPLAFCGWTGSAGLPVIAMMPEAVTGGVTATITGPSGPLQTCALSPAEHQRRGPADPAGRQRGRRDPTGAARPRHVHRHRHDAGPHCQLELHGRSRPRRSAPPRRRRRNRRAQRSRFVR